jgi:hypothetical protein
MPNIRPFFKTTWNELVRKHYLRSYPQFTGRYVLTGIGLRLGLELHGLDKSPDFKQMLGKISKYLKDLVKGRRQVAPICVETIAQLTGLQAGFVINVIEAKLFEYWFNQYGAVWAPGFNMKLIIVPIDFGLDPLP